MNAAEAQPLSATEALLAQAAAETSVEVLTARLHLIATGSAVIKPMDRTLLVSGDGTAGHGLLGGERHGVWLEGPGPSCAIRSYRLIAAAEREEAAAARARQEASC